MKRNLVNNLRITGWLATLGAIAIWTLLGQSAPANAQGLLDDIKQRGEIVVGTEAAFEPFEFIKDGEIVGYNKDILDYIVSGLGVELNQLDLPFQGLLPGLLAGKFDLMATSTGINPERAASYAFTRPIGTAAVVVVVRVSEDEINSLDDLAGKVVATQLASASQPLVEDLNETFKTNGGEGMADIKLFTSFPETQVALASGQVDAIAIPSPVAAVLMRNIPDTFRVVGRINEPRFLAWVLRPSDTDLRDYINEKIGELVDSGMARELQIKWFGFEMDMPAEGYLPEGAL